MSSASFYATEELALTAALQFYKSSEFEVKEYEEPKV